MAKIVPKYSSKHPRAGKPHDGMTAYKSSVLGQIGNPGAGPIKEVRDRHAANQNETKYKK